MRDGQRRGKCAREARLHLWVLSRSCQEESFSSHGIPVRARSSAAPPWKKSEKRLGRRLRRFDQTISGASMSSSLVSVAAYLVKIDEGSRKGRRKEDHLQEMEFETPIGKVS